MKNRVLLALMCGFGILLVSNASAQTTKIGMKKAKEIASQRVAGKIKSSELEKEHGKLIYSFDIQNSKGTITEVNIDAYTGIVISTEEENAQTEAAEKQAEKAEKKKGKNR
jgi:competence protein ComGC